MAYQQNQHGQQQSQEQGDRNRLQLNFGFNTPSNYTAEQGRALPTTPSSFPQPVPNATTGQQEMWGTQQGNSGINSQGYFYNNPNQYQQYANQGGVSTPGATTPGYRPQAGFQDVTNGLAHQFQHQSLGTNSPRSTSPYRQATPTGQRSRTASSQPQYGNFLNAAAGAGQQPQAPSIYDDEPPPKNAEKYSTVISERGRLQKLLTQEFFKENVERARARNERYLTLWKPLQDVRFFVRRCTD